VNINVSFRLGKKATGTHKMVENVYRNESLFHSCVFKWFKIFSVAPALVQETYRGE